MDSLVIEKTKKTPYINFDFKSGKFLIEGRCMPENTFEFFENINLSLQEYLKSPNNTVVDIQLEYFNSSALKYILKFLEDLSQIKINKSLEVNWFYEKDDEDIFEVGQDYQDILGIRFNLIELQS